VQDVAQAARSWTPERIEADLREFLSEKDEWPSYREFARAGRKRLRDEVTRLGGAEAWARRLGVAYPHRRPGYAPRWTEERVRGELAEFLSGHREWPSAVTFERGGRSALRRAVARTGGPERWAAEFGLALSSRRSGSRRRWTPEALESSVQPLVARLGRWPTKAEFRAAGLESALTAMYRFEGIEAWRERLGVGPRQARARRSRRWTDERLERELRTFCRGRSTWPTEREFLAAGRGRLYRAASLYGGIAGWQRRLELRAPSRPAGVRRVRSRPGPVA
jgi:ribosomal protein L13E